MAGVVKLSPPYTRVGLRARPFLYVITLGPGTRAIRSASRALARLSENARSHRLRRSQRPTAPSIHAIGSDVRGRPARRPRPAMSRPVGRLPHRAQGDTPADAGSTGRPGFPDQRSWG